MVHGRSSLEQGVTNDNPTTSIETNPLDCSRILVVIQSSPEYVEASSNSWRKLLTEPKVVRRGLRFAVIVGMILIAINHGDAILRGDIGPERILKMALTVVVPYCVSVFSSVSAMRHYEDKPC